MAPADKLAQIQKRDERFSEVQKRCHRAHIQTTA